MFKKSILLIGLLTVGITIPATGVILTNEDKKVQNNLVTIVNKIGASISDELKNIGIDAGRKKEKLSIKDRFNHFIKYVSNYLVFGPVPDAVLIDAHWDELTEQIVKELPTMKIKIAHVVNHELTPEQRELTIQLLEDTKSLTSMTYNDFLEIGQGLSNQTTVANFGMALNKYVPKDLSWKLDNLSQPRDVNIALRRKLEKIDLHNKAFNGIISLMCRYYYIKDFSLVSHANIKNKQIKTTIDYMINTMAPVFDVFVNGRYYEPSFWDIKLIKATRLYGIINTFCVQVLEAIETDK